MAELPILPLYVERLLADTHHFTTEEFGAYVRILLGMWANGGRLSAKDLQKFSGLSKYNWSKMNETILAKLTIIEGQASQKRLTDTWMKVQEKRKKSAHAADTRWTRQRIVMLNLQNSRR